MQILTKMEVHVGKLIERRLEELGMTKAEFGRRMNTSRQNVNSLLRKRSLDTDFLQRIGMILGYDFFKHFRDITSDGLTVSPEEAGPSVKILIELPRDSQDQLLNLVLGKGRMEALHRLLEG